MPVPRQPTLALTALVTLAACNPAAGVRGSLFGDANVAAVQAAADCRTDKALALARSERDAGNPSVRLFSRFVQYAVLADTGRTAAAETVLAGAQADPALNPDGQSLEDLREAGEAVRDGIVAERIDTRGSPTC